MREPEVGKTDIPQSPPIAIAFPKPFLIPYGDDQGIPPISIAFPKSSFIACGDDRGLNLKTFICWCEYYGNQRWRPGIS